ncbi:hypothetical protein TNIN_218811 [Trichonephila inaurata madagascariensis]|uniref:Uncharacterized protein n=1 Tax=Trichonephila inaurata madagascariensis TaxID=2747483 RepID=A0A8X6WZJ3_9ARAC|nr:hypothetical protein TNIN_218811 [Trichonephila inaurata madagascariensis]
MSHEDKRDCWKGPLKTAGSRHCKVTRTSDINIFHVQFTQQPDPPQQPDFRLHDPPSPQLPDLPFRLPTTPQIPDSPLPDPPPPDSPPQLLILHNFLILHNNCLYNNGLHSNCQI